MKTIAVSGGFDPVHVGHVRMFIEAKKLGDKLVIILNNDYWLKKKKGFVFMPESERKEILNALGCVDEVVLTKHKENDDDVSVCSSLKEIKPDIYANGGDRKADNIPEYQLCNELNIEMVFNVGGGKVRSSSDLVKKDVHVLILAAGYATRMCPLTLDISKPLLPVGNRLMIDWVIDKVNEISDVRGITIVTNDKFYSDYKEWKKRNNLNVVILNDKTTCNENRLGMLGDIVFGLKHIDSSNVLVVGGDNLFKFDLNELISVSRQKNSSCIGAVKLDELGEAKKMGIFLINDDKKAVDFEEKPQNPKSMIASTCCYMLDKKAVELLRKFEGDGDKTHIVPLLMQNFDTYVCPYSEKWIDIGSKEQYEKINKEYSRK